MPAGQNLPSESRALVPTDSAPGPAANRPPVRVAAFVAHLIATDRHLPQTCERRRAEPSEAIAAYRAAFAKTHRHDDQ